MSESKAYNWLYDLRSNALTKEVKEDYVATVRTLKCMTVEDIAEAIVSERTEFRLDTLVAIINLVDEKIRQLVCQGHTVQTGSAHYAPSITGVFTGAIGTFNSEVNTCTINVSAAKALREEVTRVIPEFSGYIQDLGGARIGLVTDISTGKTDGTITIGGIIEVAGNKIKCVNADGSALGKVTLVNTETQAETVINSLAINEPSRLMILVPTSLPAGTYRLRIETYYSVGSQYLKTVRTIEYNMDLVAGTSEGDNY